jgi:hypothetical protein
VLAATRRKIARSVVITSRKIDWTELLRSLSASGFSMHETQHNFCWLEPAMWSAQVRANQIN